MDLQQKLRSAATLGVLMILLLLGLVWGWSHLTAPFPSLSAGGSSDEPTSTCDTVRVKAGQKVHSNMVTVSVFNAGTTEGLATDVMEQLEARGFAPGNTGNAPREVDDPGTAVVYSYAPTNPAVRLVARQFGADTQIVKHPGDALGIGIVVVVGNDVKKLSPADRTIVASADATVCGPPA
jgi:hypothetical protein